MKLSITRIIGFFLLVPTLTLGIFILLILFYSLLTQMDPNVHFTNLAGKQRILSERLGHYAHIVYLENQHRDRESLREYVAAFDRTLKVLEQGGEIDGLTLKPPPPEMYSSLDNVKQLWKEINSSLLVVANQPTNDPQSRIAYDFVISNIPVLTEKSDEVYWGFSEWDKRQRYKVFHILATLVGLSFVMLVAGVWTTKRYVTERIKARKKLEEALERAERSDRVKSLFLANMSHEIRTPLNSIMGFTDIIESSTRELVSPEEKSFFDTIRDSVKRLMRTIHGILDISQIESGTMEIKPILMDLGELTEKVVKECQPMAREKDLKLSFNSSMTDAIILADEYSIVQSLTNLVDNAIKYTEKGKVEVSLKGEGKNLMLRIQDTGIGMSKDYIDNLYDIFSQESTGYSRSFEGTGLGMALTKQHLDMNNVKIDVESTKGIGTTFTLTFTFESAEKQPPEKKVKVPAKPAVDTSQEPGTKPTVLVVEDDVGSQHLVRFFLKDSNEVLLALSVAEAKETLKKQAVEVILLDLSLHGDEDGLDLARYLRKTKKWKDLPIIALTAHAFVTDRENCLAAGCNDYLTKPINRETLVEKIKLYV